MNNINNLGNYNYAMYETKKEQKEEVKDEPKEEQKKKQKKVSQN